MTQACTRLQALQQHGVTDVQETALLREVIDLQSAIEKLTVYKELRLPVGLRAALRTYAVVVAPIFCGPFFGYLSISGFGIMFAIITADMVGWVWDCQGGMCGM